ncbi:VOC family protein [Cytobacillus sp. Hm23]
MKIIPYLYFAGNCEQALNYYKDVFEGEIISLQRFHEAPDMPVNEENKNKVLHARFQMGEQTVYFSDGLDTQAIEKGNQVTLTIEFSKVDQIETVYSKLAESGEIIMPLQDTFWGAKYGKVVDTFGVCWDLNCQLS